MTITTLRPTGAALNNAAVSVVGAALAATALNDNSDASYVTGTADNAYLTEALDDMGALGATQRVKSCRIRSRSAGANLAPGMYETTVLRLVQPSLGGAPVGTLKMLRGSSTISTISGPVAYTAPGGRAWTKALVDNLAVWHQWFIDNQRADHYVRLYETYVDVDVNNQPTVSGTPTVTNFTNNATPTVAWVYADADGDAQTAWRVKVFNSAVYGAGNFDPETFVADWDSGVRGGTDASVDIATALQNGVTYQAYVKVGQGWPGPQGNPWWSTWVASAPFTISFDPPLTPIIQSATVLADSNQYRAMLSILVPYNLLTADNSNFEVSLGNWAALANCTVVRDTAQHAVGLASMKMTSSAGGDMTARCALDFITDPRVDGGQTYTALASFHASGAGTVRSCAVGLEWLKFDQTTVISTVFGSNVTDSAGAGVWTQASVTAAAPGDAFYARVIVKVIAAGAAGEVHWVDKVSVHAGTGTTWMPGGYVNSQGDLLVERGEYLLDDRGPAENWFHPQVASAGTVMRNHGYGFNIDTSVGALTWRWLDKLITAVGDTPAGMLDWKPGTAATPVISFGAWFYGGTAYMAPCVAGLTHVFSVWAWVSSGTWTGTVSIQWRDAAGAFLSATTSGTFTLTTTPQQIIISGAAPGGVFLATGAVTNFGSDATRHVYFTRLGFGLGSIPVDGKRAKGKPTGILATGTPAGVTWVPVRFDPSPTLSLPPGFVTGQVETVPDYEYVPGRPTLYRCSIAYDTGTTIAKSAYSAQVMAYAVPPAVSLLRSITDPTLQVAVNRRKQFPLARVDDAAIYHPLGADGSPVQVRDWVGGEDGQLIVVTSTEAQYARLQALLFSGDVLQVQWAQGGRTYMLVTERPTDETISQDTDWCDADGTQSWIRYAVHTLAYVETQAP